VVVVEDEPGLLRSPPHLPTGHASVTRGSQNFLCMSRRPFEGAALAEWRWRRSSNGQSSRIWKLVSRVFCRKRRQPDLVCALGFREVGIYQKHGKLDGQWRDVVIVERFLL